MGVPLEPKGTPTEIWESAGAIESRKYLQFQTNVKMHGIQGSRELQGSFKEVPLEPKGAPNGDPGECWGYKIQEILTISKKGENEWHPGCNTSSKPPLMEPKGLPLEPKWAPMKIWESPGGIKSRKYLQFQKIPK